ncbi:MAG TPA: APC family permease [Ktedonobacterales bacterium]|nr:APC family permease [Ktedonobacterales bacterium]
MQTSETVDSSVSPSSTEEHQRGRLGFFLCWAVVFADIGTSVYYVPGILYGQVGNLAGFFVLLTMLVFILLTLKYAEVTARYPQGGGVVTVAASNFRPWTGAFGGMLELGDYFLTAAISALSGLTYLSVVVPVHDHLLLLLGTLVVLVLLGALNWWGVSESAKVSAVGAVIAFTSDIAIVLQVVLHVPFSTLLHLIPEMFEGRALTPLALLTGFAGSFLAFSGLESISQLSPVMKTPRKRTSRRALLAVVLTVGVTSPLLTLFATTLLDASKDNPDQFISLLGSTYGGTLLGVEVAISASALLIFASNTAIIGCYHVLLALSRMQFLPPGVQKRNKWRGTPHYAIALAAGIPIIILLLVRGDITLLGDMYAFGLLGAFSLTCLGIDVARWRDWRRQRERQALRTQARAGSATTATVAELVELPRPGQSSVAPVSRWMFALGVLTTALVMLAWGTNLVYKHLATEFGVTVTGIGLLTAFITARYLAKQGKLMVFPTEIYGAIPGSILAVLPPAAEGRKAVIHAACQEAEQGEVIFLYRGTPVSKRRPELFENADPYLTDEAARAAFSEAAQIARAQQVRHRAIYVSPKPDVVFQYWQLLQPRDTIFGSQEPLQVNHLAPDLVRHSHGPGGQVTHYVKNWQLAAAGGA